MVYFHHHVNRKPLINQLSLGGGVVMGRGEAANPDGVAHLRVKFCALVISVYMSNSVREI